MPTNLRTTSDALRITRVIGDSETNLTYVGGAIALALTILVIIVFFR